MSKLRFGGTHEPPAPGEEEPTPLEDWLAENDAYLRACLQINPEDIQQEFVRIPGDLAYWNSRYADAIRRHLTSKLDEKKLKANLEIPVREALAEAGGKVTEAMVTAGIESHEDYVAAQMMTIEAEVEKHKCYGHLDAIRSKRDMVISLGAHLRIELQHDPMIREVVQGSRRKASGDD